MVNKQTVPLLTEESEEFYHRLLDELPGPAYTCDMLGYLKLFNQAAEDAWGIKPVIGKTKWCGSWKIYQANGIQISLDDCPMAITIKEGRIVSHEVIVERPDGVRMNVLPHPRFIKDSKGTIVGVINILEDITALRIVEERLHESVILQCEGAEQFRADMLRIKSLGLQLEKDVEERTCELEQAKKEIVFQNDEKGKRAAELILTNKDLTFQINKAIELTITNAELVFQNAEKGKLATELIIANNELAFQIEEKGKRAAELALANIELAFQNEEREKRAAELRIANRELILQGEEKEKRASELVIANKELAFQNEEKGKRAAELIVANEELAFQNREKEKRAAELIIINTELEEFTHVSSHDLQEPLRKIQTFSNLILKDESDNLSEKGKHYLSRMQSAAFRMRKLIDDLLGFSHLKIAERKFEETELATIIEEVKNELKETIDEKNVIIEASGLCKVNIIPFQFRQIMHNLISNALKFSRPGVSPHIIIESRVAKGAEFDEGKLDHSMQYCHISVSDNGIGFDPKHKDVIFKVFQRLQGAEKYSGSGIGLAIVKRVVDNHNGIISATGAVNKGATFNIYIPVPNRRIQ